VTEGEENATKARSNGAEGGTHGVYGLKTTRGCSRGMKNITDAAKDLVERGRTQPRHDKPKRSGWAPHDVFSEVQVASRRG
jgi:hypothetical protein